MENEDEIKFKIATAGHEIKILHDVEVYRHVSMRNPELGSLYSYEIITAPQVLFYFGDMGDFAFQRYRDMFELFRQNNPDLRYLHEKLVAYDREGSKEYSDEAFKREVMNALKEWEFDSHSEELEVFKHVKENVLDADCGFSDGQIKMHHAFERVAEYRSPYGHEFSDFWECTLTEYAPRFKWCCRAITKAVKAYDKIKGEM